MTESLEGNERLRAALEMQEQQMSKERQAHIAGMLEFLQDGQSGKVWAVGRVNRLMEMTAASGEKINSGNGDSLVIMEKGAFESKATALENANAEVTQIGGGGSRKMIRFWTEDGTEVVQEVLLVEPGEHGYNIDLGGGKGMELRGQISQSTSSFGEGVALPVFVPESMADQYREALEKGDIQQLTLLQKFMSDEDKQKVEADLGTSYDELVYGKKPEEGQEGEEQPQEAKVTKFNEEDVGAEVKSAQPVEEGKEPENLGTLQEVSIAYNYDNINAIIAHAQADIYEQFQDRENEPITGEEAYRALMEAGRLYQVNEETDVKQTVAGEDQIALGNDRSTTERGRVILGVLPQIGRVENVAELNALVEKLVLDAMTYTRDTGNMRAFKLQVCVPTPKAEEKEVAGATSNATTASF